MMKSKPALSFIILLTVLCNFSSAQKLSKEQKEILQLQDMRSFGKNNELIEYLSSETNEDAYRSALALANIGDSAAVDELGKILLQKPDSYLWHTSAFALGEIGTKKAAEYLSKALIKYAGVNDKLTRELVNELLNNLGRAGDENDLNTVLSIKTNDEAILPFIALSIARFGMRKVKNDNSFTRLDEIMRQSESTEVRRYTAYAFNRIGDKASLAPYKDKLLSLTESGDPFTRMWAYSALGKLADTSIADKLLYELDIEADWRVRVNICAALGNQPIDFNSPLTDRILTSLLQHGSEDNSAHVSITAWQSLGKLFAGIDTRNPLARKIQQDIQFVLNTNKPVDVQVKAEMIKAYAKIFRDEIKDELLGLFSKSDNYDIKAAAVSSFSVMENGLVYKELRDSISADVMRYNAIHPNKDGSMIGSADLAKIYKAFVEALAGLDDKLDAENRNNVRLIFSEFAASKNEAITDLCLTNLQDSLYLEYRTETGQVMTFDYQGFAYPKDKEVMLMYIQTWGSLKYEGVKDLLTGNLEHRDYDIAKVSADALKNITGKDYEGAITAPKYRTDFDWKFIENLENKQYAVINTSKGIIKIELFYNDAPFTVQNFVKLSESGFYNNTLFHRVVPNFVIQGGDPTGTGYGGPGYSIRSEFSPIPYDAYTVGMASSGKDTEGSQFFITHCPTPHLDGKYTLFGKVVEGFDAVDKIQIGDRIEGITFSAVK